jgi:hypothetical protein
MPIHLTCKSGPVTDVATSLYITFAVQDTWLEHHPCSIVSVEYGKIAVAKTSDRWDSAHPNSNAFHPMMAMV